MSNQEQKAQNLPTISITTENFEQNWPKLGLINLNAILPDKFQKTLSYWSYLAHKAISTIGFSKEINISKIIDIMKICRAAVLFVQKSYKRGENCDDPIKFLTGSNGPLKSPPIIDFPLKKTQIIPESICFFLELCKHLLNTEFSITQIINISIFLSIEEFSIKNTSLTARFENEYGRTKSIPDESIQKVLNFDNIINTLREIRLKINQSTFYILKFLYQKIFNYEFKLPYFKDNFYQNLISKNLCANEDTILLTVFNYIKGDPVQFDPKNFGENHIFFCYLCLNDLISKANTESFLSKFYNKLNPWFFFVYAYYINIEKNNFADNFLNYLKRKELTPLWKAVFDFILQSPNIKTIFDIDENYVNEIKELFSMNKNKDGKPETPENCPKIPDKINDPLMAPTLFWYKFNKKPISLEIVSELLKKLNAYFIDCLKETTCEHPLYYYSECLEFHSKYFTMYSAPAMPKFPIDFLQMQPPLPPQNCYTISNLVLGQLIDLYLNNSYPLPADLLTVFCCNYYISSDIKSRIFSSLDNKSSQFVLESNIKLVEHIFDAPETDPDKFGCIQTISPLFTIQSFSSKFVARLIKSGDKYAPIVNEILSSQSFKDVINSIEPSELKIIIDNVVSCNQREIAKKLMSCISDADLLSVIVFDIALTKPSVALFLLKNMTTKISTQIISLITKKDMSQNFPTDPAIISDFISFLLSFLKTVPHSQFVYQKSIVAKELPTTWEEDAAAKSTEVLTRAFVNIWEFPPMSRVEMKNESRSILNNTKPLHNHDSIFDHYCCSYHSGKIVQPSFYCYTCGIYDRFSICLGCAMTCHRGHDIVFVRDDSNFQCDCYRVPSMCIFNPKQEDLLSNDELSLPNIETTLDQLHRLVSEGEEISIHDQELFASLLSGSRMIDVHPNEAYFGKDGENDNSHDSSRNTPPASPPTPKAAPKIKSIEPVDNNNVLNLFLKLASINFDEIDYVKNLELCWQEIVKVDKSILINDVLDQPSETIPIINFNQFDLFSKVDALKQRSMIAPLHLASFVNRSIIVTSNEKSLCSYNYKNGYNKLCSIDLPDFITQINADCANDPSLIAVSTLYKTFLIKVDEKGEFSIKNPDVNNNEVTTNNPFNSCIINIVWLKNANMRLAIILRNKILIYDISQDYKSELYMELNLKENDYFRSATIVEFNKEEFIVATLDSNNFAIHPCHKESSQDSKSVLINDIFSFNCKLPKPVISYCPSFEYFIISSSSSNVSFVKKGDFFNRNSEKQFTLNLPSGSSNLFYIGNHPMKQNLLFFIQPYSGSIVTIEITSTKITYSMNDFTFDKSFINNDNHVISIFKGPSNKGKFDELYSISLNKPLNVIQVSSSSMSTKKKPNSNDRFLSSPPASPTSPNIRQQDEDSEGSDASKRFRDIFLRSLRSILEDRERNGNDDIDPSDMLPPLKVPAIFWANSRISTDSNIKINFPFYYRNPPNILQNEKVIFDHGITDKFFEVSCQSDSEVIVGFRYLINPSSSSSHRPPFIAINNRIIKVDMPRWYMLPLDASEIEPRKTYKIKIANKGGLDVNCDGFSVFVMDRKMAENCVKAQIQKVDGVSSEKSKFMKKHEWFFESSSLLSFNDSCSSYGLMKIISRPSKKLDPETEAEIESNSKILKKSLIQLSFLFSPKCVSQNKDGENNEVDNKNFFSPNESQIRELVRLLYTKRNASIPARRILLRIIFSKVPPKSDDSEIFAKNKIVMDNWASEIRALLKEKKVLPEMWDIFMRDYSLMPKEQQSKISEFLWENNPPKENEFAFFSAFLS